MSGVLRALYMKYVYGDLTLCTYSFIIDAHTYGLG